MSQLPRDLKPERVFYYFEQLCGIPHGSYNTKAISDYCVGVAQTLGLKVRQDELNNVVIFKPASPGYENLPTLMIQGHLDMVCEKNAEVDFDFMTEGLNLYTEDGYVKAKGTTLGGDDGIAVAYGLAILEDNTLCHPALEVVFTTEEEVGMEGVAGLDVSDLQAAYLLNLDSEDEGHILAGCAGGLKSTVTFQVSRQPQEGFVVDLKIKGLAGGHSGTEINKGRANANILMGRLLFELHKQLNYGIIQLHGGLKDNAIPREAFAALVVHPEEGVLVKEIVNDFQRMVENEFYYTDPDVEVQCEIHEQETVAEAFSMMLMEKVIFMLMEAPNGVQTMSGALPGLVESSLNLGIVITEETQVKFCFAVRSAIDSLKVYISDKLRYLAELFGGDYNISGLYPEWSYKKDSKLRDLLIGVYEEMYHETPVVETIHAGLECGLLLEKMPQLDIVSIGPDMKDIHTPREALDIASVERTYEYILEILKQFKEYCVRC